MSSSSKLNITIETDTKESRTNIDRLNKEFGKLLTTMGKTPKDLKQFSQLAQDFIATGKAADDLDQETKDLLKSYNTLLGVAKSRDILDLVPHKDIAEQIKEVEEAFENLKKSNKLTHHEMAQAALHTEARIKELKAQTNGVGEALSQVKSQFVALGASTAGLGLAVKQAVDFEAAMADVAKVTGGTEEQIKTLGANIKDLTATLPLTADELANIAAAGGQLGVPLENLEKFIGLAAKMSTAFSMSAEEAGQAVAKLTNVFKLSLSDVESVGDAINTLGNNMAATEKDILEVMTRTGGMAKQFGLAAEETAALGASLLAMGKTPEVAATGINAMLGKLQTANVASSEFKGALASIGLQAEDLAQSIQANPQEALTSFLKTLQQLEPMARAEILKKLFGQEYQDDLAILVDSVDQYGAALGMVSDKLKTAGAMQREFDERMKTTAAQLQLAKNSIEELAINLGSVFLPSVKAVAGGFSDVTRGVAGFVEKFPLISGLVGGLATLAVSMGALRASFLAGRLALVAMGVDGAASIKKLHQPLKTVTAQLGMLKVAASVAGAAFAGWTVGTDLSERFEEVRQAGVAMVAGLVHGFEEMRYYWELWQATVTGQWGAFEAITRQHEQRLEEITAALTKTWQEASDQTKKSTDEVKEKQDKLTDSVDETKKAFKELNKAVLEHDPQKIESTIKYLNEIAAAGKDAGVAIDSGLRKSLEGLSGKEVLDFQTNITAAFMKAGEASWTLADVLKDTLTVSMGNLGLSAEQFSQSMTEAEEDVLASFTAVSDSAQATSSMIAIAFKAASEKIKTIEGIESLKAQLKTLGKTGKMSIEDVERAVKALDNELRDAADDTDPVIQAMERLGVISTESLDRLAEEAKADFELIQKSGTATAHDLKQAFEAYSEKAIEAAKAHGKAEASATEKTLEAEKAALGLTDALESAGESGTKAGDNISSGMAKAAGEVKAVATAADKAATAIKKASNIAGESIGGNVGRNPRIQKEEKKTKYGRTVYASEDKAVSDMYGLSTNVAFQHFTTELFQDFEEMRMKMLRGEDVGIEEQSSMLSRLETATSKAHDLWNSLGTSAEGAFELPDSVAQAMREMEDAIKMAAQNNTVKSSQTSTTTQPTPTTPTASTTQVVKKVEITLKLANQSSSVTGIYDDSDVDKILDILAQAGLTAV